MTTFESLIESWKEQHDFTEEKTREIIDFYLRNQLAEFCKHTGAFKVRHGMFLERDILENAYKQATA